jgi:hypothetical protein
MVFGTFMVESLHGVLKQLCVMIQISRVKEIRQVVRRLQHSSLMNEKYMVE